MKSGEKLFFFLVLILVILIRWRYVNTPFERDEGEYAYAGWQILTGKMPYANFYNMKLPGVYYMYALIFKFWGYSVASVRFVLLFLNLLSAFFIFKTGQLFKGGWVAAAVFLLMSLGYEGQGVMANCEHFVVFFAVWGLWYLYSSQKLLSVVVGGLLLGTSFLMKQHAVVFGLIAFLWILQKNWSDVPKMILLVRLGLFCTAYLTPLSILIFFIYQEGIFQQFYFLTVEYASAYSALSQPSLKYISNFKFIFADNIGFWLLFFYVMVRGFKQKKQLTSIETPIISFTYLSISFGLSFLGVCPGWHFRPHYFQLIFPFAALIVAYGWSVWQFRIRLFSYILPKVAILAVCFILSLTLRFDYFFLKTPRQLVQDLYQNEFFSDTYDIGQYLKQNTQPTDRIALFGNEPQIWFYAQKQAASGYIYTYPLVELQPFASTMTEQYIAETERSQPEWLIYSNISKGTSNKNTLNRLDTWWFLLSKNYTTQGVLYQKTKTEGDMQWGNKPIDTSRTVLMLVLRR